VTTTPPPLPDESIAAARDAALDMLAELTRYVRRIGGYMSETDQQIYRRAQAMLVENGRKI
jgi:hypothetical protein